MPLYSDRQRVVKRLLRLDMILLLSLIGSAMAYEGLTVGVMGGVPTGGTYVVNVRAVQPLFESEVNGTDLQFSVRADLSNAVTFQSLPAVGLATITSSTQAEIERYLGLGGGISFLGTSLGGSLWSLYGLAGFRVPITPRLNGVLEVQVSGNRLLVAPNLGVALEYTFGGR